MRWRARSSIGRTSVGWAALALCAAWSSAALADARALRTPDRERLDVQRREGARDVVLLLAVDPSRWDAVIQRVTQLGGRVQYRHQPVGYLRVLLPVANAWPLVEMAAVSAAMVDGPVDYVPPDIQRRIGAAPARPSHNDAAPLVSARRAAPPPTADTAPDNPYNPARDVGVTTLLRRSPTNDGRGVVVAVIDTTIDFLSPQLQTARTMEGRPVAKFADILTPLPDVEDPANDEVETYYVVHMDRPCTAAGTAAWCDGVSYTFPSAGTFRLGELHEDHSRVFSVLWNESSNQVWVDTDQDRSFANERVLTDYAAHHELGVFGHDNPATPVRETVAFAIQIDRRNMRVLVIPGTGEHGTAVVGGAFGGGFFGGTLNGVAPGAQLVSIPAGKLTHGVLEALITAFKHPAVDIVTLQHVLYWSPNDGSSAFAQIVDRLIEHYGKLSFASAGNFGEQLAQVMEAAASQHILAVGSYMSAQTSRFNYGFDAPYPDTIGIGSSRGPRSDGALKPDLLAPSPTLSLFPAHKPTNPLQGAPFALPPGYAISNGSSTAAPYCAAAAAVVLSAARQEKLDVDWRKLRRALLSTARFLPHYGAHEQGAGLVDADAALQWIRNSVDGPTAADTLNIRASAHVRWVSSKDAILSNVGPGLFEREGWAPGRRGTRWVSLMREGGPAKPLRLRVEIKANTTAFKVPESVVLPVKRPVALELSINPQSAGAHSGLLRLLDQNSRVVFATLLTIVAAQEFASSRGNRITDHAEIKWGDSRSWFIRVPPHTKSLTLNTSIKRGTVWSVPCDPQNRYIPHDPPFQTYHGPGEWSQRIENPASGVWQFSLENKDLPARTVTADPAQVSIELSIER